MERLGDALMQQDHYEEAEPLLRAALAQRGRLVGRATRTAEALDRLATLFQRRNRVRRRPSRSFARRSPSAAASSATRRSRWR